MGRIGQMLAHKTSTALSMKVIELPPRTDPLLSLAAGSLGLAW